VHKGLLALHVILAGHIGMKKINLANEQPNPIQISGSLDHGLYEVRESEESQHVDKFVPVKFR
jgi:hypothetical protein